MSKLIRLGILASHPIQYHAPWFRGLADQVDLEVFFAHRPSAKEQGAGFGEAFTWDIDLSSGYSHTFLENNARRPGVNRFLGCDTPQIREIICGSPSNEEPTTYNARRSPFDAFIVCGWNLKCYWQAIRACHRARISVLVRGDSQLDPTQSWFRRVSKEITHRLTLRQFDGFLSPGTRHREYLLHYGVPEERIFLVPHFVDNERLAAQAGALRPVRSALRGSWNIPEDAFCALFCGKFIRKKRPLDLVKAARSLVSRHPSLKIHLLFAGAGELGPQMRESCNVVFDADSANSQFTSISSTKPNASFAGFLNQTEISRAYVAADVLVLPSDYSETWGLVVNEAMASGLPAIVSDAVGCAVDLVQNGGTGYSFARGNTTEFAEKLGSIALQVQHQNDFRLALLTKIQSCALGKAVTATLSAVRTSAGASLPI